MDHIFPHPTYAEDQRFSRTILTTHVLHRFTAPGTALGMLIGSGKHALSARKSGQSWKPTQAVLLRGSSTGILVSLGFGAIGLTAKMYGREEIEWQDRAWRLLENRGQNQQDVASVVGMVLGAALGAGSSGPLGVAAWRRVVGNAGMCGIGVTAVVKTWDKLNS